MTTNTHSSDSDPTPHSSELPTGYIKVVLDYCPKMNGKKFEKWCKEHGFSYLGSDRRAWCSEFRTYLRGASGVAYNDGEAFLFYEDDLIDLDGIIARERQKAVEEYKSKNTLKLPPMKDVDPEIRKLVNDNIDDLFWKDDVAAQSKESK